MTATQTPPAAPSILCVDDEPSILSALKRLFRPHGFTVLTAGSGQEALELLAQQPVDVVISDMRMPQMDGAQFLEQVFQRWPETKRILLTGYADANATIAAVNLGHIWRYVAKPWNDAELVAAVQQALAHRRLERENAALVALTRRQNEELKQLNAALEAKVAARTAELQQMLAMLEKSHEELKKGFMTTVKVLSSLFELRGGKLAGHSRRVAETARQLAQALQLDEAAAQDVLLAALLHDIGKISLPDHLLDKPFNTMPAEERAQVMTHPQRGELVLNAVDQLKKAAVLVRHHHECFDGSGYPDHLVGLAIPLGARILAVANDFDALQLGTLVSRPLKPAEARTYIFENRGKRYDPQVVAAFMAKVADQIPEEVQELPMRPGTLRPGMVLTRDLMHPDGYLLLAKGQAVDSVVIEQLLKIESLEGHRLTLYVHPEK
ncbi:MAG: HD domain-containing phosphohydrolase [Pseudomonadota bacterium]|uniref:HD domain-containing phosphohydrolase n=1 Tax=Sulfuricystis thermophila TaxID=2496847 RepID=UPI001035A33D|nr:HD domain-containing phosphohydrolase [Sulfuricystis thermophila]MDI6750180.1 response regulator [Rhodocyclaceae bacterium]